MKAPVYIAGLAMSLLVGTMVGYSLSPEYAMANESKSMMQMDLGKADRYVDLRYINGMIAHHQSAIYMLEQALEHSTRSEIQQLAQAVIAADKADIETLYADKKAWYNDTRKVSTYTQIQLGEANETFDLRLLNALIEHHIEAIEIAKEVRTKSTRTETLDRADTVITALSENQAQLEQWRKEWYGR